MTINAPNNQQDIMCGEDTLQRVSTITYLGSKIRDDGKVDVELLNRSKKATQLFYQLTKKATQLFYQLNNTILGKKEVSIEAAKMTRACADALTRRVAGSKVGSKRRVGRPAKAMDQRVKELALKRGKLVNELKTMTQDRRMWRTWVDTPHQPMP
ncbi:hypothetical protein QE152_g8175 [Popillia japonica]|uniref:Uncharacterized protein n=1 Tax=Popillia japonica TaxID=7064 RepID=A0AAW1MDQ2_POPJA